MTTIANSASSSDKTLTLTLSSGTSYSIDSSYSNASITIVNTDAYTPPNTLVWFNSPQSLTLSNVQVVKSWGDLASNATCTHPISAYQNTEGSLPTYHGSNISLLFDSLSMLNVDSNTCMDNISAGITQRSMAFVFQTGSDVTTDQILYEQGNSTRGLSVSISGGYLNFAAYDSSWNQYSRNAITTNTFYAVILEFKASAPLRSVLSTGLGTGSVTWATATSTGNAGTSIAAVSDNGIGIGGINNGGKFYASASSSYVSSSGSGVNLLQGVKLYEIVLMNNTIVSTAGTTLSNFQSYLAGKYAR